MNRNTMQYATDAFSFTRKALLKSRDCWDLTNETSITKFEISGTEPEGTRRRVIFFIDGYYYKYVNGVLDRYDDRLDVDSILKHGNTVGELLALTEDSLRSFLGKRIFPLIALEAPATSPVMPRIKLALRVNCYNDRYNQTLLSPIYELKRGGETCKIISVTPSKITNGNGTISVKCKIKNPITGWSDDWLLPEETKYLPATAVQFRTESVVTTLDGSDYAGINHVVVSYTTDSDKLSGNATEIVTLSQEYPHGELATCYALAKHSELIDCTASAFVTFSESAKKRVELSLGTATGEEQTVTLENINIAPDSIHLEIGNRNCTDFYFDTANSTITFTGRAGDAVIISYEYGAGDGDWYPMTKDLEYNDEGIYSTRFTYRLPSGNGKTASAVRFEFDRNSGRATNQRLGIGNGREQAFYIPHKAKAESVNCTGSWKYDEDAQVLKVVAPIDEQIVVSYEWSGVMPEIFGYVVGWQPSLSVV